MTKLKTITLTVASAVVLVVCAPPLPPPPHYNFANISQLKIGESTDLDVIQLIGEPLMQKQNDDGTMTWLYPCQPGQDPRILNARTIKFVVTLDANGKVKNYQTVAPQ